MTMRNMMVAILGTCLMTGVTAARSESQTAQDQKEGAKSQVAATAAHDAVQDPTYKIGPQDILKIDVWKEEQLTRTVPVRPDGKITLPLLNDVQAAGLAPMELANEITERLKKYINNPQVSVSVTEINSRRVYVTGEVVKGGAYALLPHMTVLQALSSSGGFTQFARIKNIYVLRTEGGKSVKIPFNYREAVKGKNPEQNIELQPGDVIVVP
jgi:polysaccharide export outer membrane protein